MANGSLFQSSTFKILGIGFLALLMSIPLSMVSSLRSERADRRLQAEQTIADAWGSATRVSGPIIAVPQRQLIREEKVTREIWTWWYVLADELNADVSVSVEERHKGIYSMPVYIADVRIGGKFSSLAAQIPQTDGELIWSRAELLLPISDPAGMRALNARVGEATGLRLVPSSRQVSGISMFHTETLNINPAADLDFEFTLKQAGTRGLDFLPLARSYHANLSADWPDPDFYGSVLPQAKPESAPGQFAAQWQVLEFNRSFPSVWNDAGGSENYTSMESAAFGARLYRSADVYQQNERSTKYGLLFVALTFGVFFLFETLQRLRVHPVQYLLVGSALTTFYLLLLAASEHLSFGLAYALGATPLGLIIGGYCSAVLKSWRRGLGILFWLWALYGVLFVLITREDFALIMGSAVVLSLIAVTMFLTRKVDWYRVTPNISNAAPVPDSTQSSSQ